MKIEELKEKFKANTSEELFGIDKQPDESCPKIDKGIKEWLSVLRDIESYCKDLKRCDTIDDAESIGGCISSEIGSVDVYEDYEWLRKQCENIRAWGQTWKDLAKKLIEERSDISDLLDDKFSVIQEDA